MRVEDAPPAGWYPDPEGGSRLRWWEGTDWSDRWRAPPTVSEVDRRLLVASTHRDTHPSSVGDQGAGHQLGSLSRHDSEAVINQVRMAARAEAERAATMLRQEARSAARSFTPLITEYTTKITRWFRIAAVVAVLLLIGWVLFQIFAQASLFEWIGDRIDNLGDNSGVVVGILAGAALALS